ncbi:nitric oxide reductase activation protein NorD [Mycobacterium sp. 852002-51057_SCH5723018]|uniref:nitric oxide reductase activation protein NorD n=1 Tax=Mycobacterium sp. 852002-51057_SCH5723018 TaxID=1834094 RepID=UPI000801D465|nr:VWA domain-containing protein [Mycobacterium sp. 852002-51057_SCH5723018]OBG23294.1 VWA domain-containing protein [Mycobacterium sp. 852002-51057_SCH5723018]
MIASDDNSPARLRLLATFIAGRSVDVAEAPAGRAAYTNGQLIFVSPGRSAAEQRREALLQSALLGAGSLDAPLVKALRARPVTARRYLALEGRRVLAELGSQIPLAAAVRPDGEPSTATAPESLAVAKGRAKILDAPEWFGVIKPSRLLAPPAGPGARPTDNDLRLEFDPIDLPEADDDGDGEQSEESKILKLFENPLFNSRTLSDYFRKLFGNSRSPGDSAPGAELQIRSVRQAQHAGANARPLPTRIHFTDDRHPGAAAGVGGALHPEWDVHNHRYRPQWCRVLDLPLTTAADVSAASVPHDEALRRCLARIGLGPKVLRGRPDGDELDTEAIVDLFVDLRSGHSPPENVYLERRKLARNLGVLILLDASGSVTDTDPDGLAVHDHQRRAAATLAVTLEELGDRVAVYAFRSHGRHSVHLLSIKAFGHRFGAVARARLNQLQPSGYTRLGAGIRGAGEILKVYAGTPNRLLVVLSDGFPYDDGYEGRYAEADARKALEELRADGVACLCLSIGAATATQELERVFGSVGYASAATLAELSPRMDELFLSSLRELAVPTASRGRA